MYLRGREVDQVETWIDSLWEESIRPNLFDGSVKAVREYHSSGALQVAMTGAPSPLVRPLLNHLGIESVIAATPEMRDGIYTGRLTAPHPRGRRKVACAEKYLKDHGYDWGQTIAVADHWDDRFLLNRAELSIVVRPGYRLRRHAVRRGWAVVNRPETIDCLSQFMAIWL